MRESIEQLKEETLLKNEQLQKYEKDINKLSDELMFYKNQNADLIQRLDSYEVASSQCSSS